MTNAIVTIHFGAASSRFASTCTGTRSTVPSPAGRFFA
jgi:hypothetical protein